MVRRIVSVIKPTLIKLCMSLKQIHGPTMTQTNVRRQRVNEVQNMYSRNEETSLPNMVITNMS